MEPHDRTPIRLKPHISETVWGGCRLVQEYGIDPQGHSNCAEAWVLSAHPKGGSVMENGPLAGLTLEALFARRKDLFGTRCAKADRFPILVKFIDAREDLSIQVHPRDTDAVLEPEEAGKTECWYILDAAPGAKLTLGFRQAIAKEEFTRAIESNTLMDYVQPFAVSEGDFFYIPAGTLHAIGKGVLLAEVQQSSDTTYRVYDYNRLQPDGQPRLLHVDKAKAVTDLLPYEPAVQHATAGKQLISCDHFTVAESGGTGTADESSFVSLLFLEADEGCILQCGGTALPVKKGDSIFLPAGAGAYCTDGSCRVLETRV